MGAFLDGLKRVHRTTLSECGSPLATPWAKTPPGASPAETEERVCDWLAQEAALAASPAAIACRRVNPFVMSLPRGILKTARERR